MTMTIDEIIKYIVYEECEHCAGLFCKQNKGCKYWNILEMLRELQWYREQDLIRRGDVLKVYNSDLCLEFDRGMCESTPNCRCCNIMRIPKAEPSVKAIYSNKPIIVHNKEDWDRFQEDINRK